MLYRFLGFELDDQLRELRFQGREVPLQPRVFDLLQSLVLHRDRVVSKDELLDAVWAGVVVTEASLQRAVSLARAVLRQGKAEDAIRTRSRHGYRFGAEVMTEDTGLEPPPAVHPANPNGSKLEIEAWREADRERGLTAAELEHWGLLAYRTADLAAAVAALERAVAGYGAVGQREAAAMCAPAVPDWLRSRRARGREGLASARRHAAGGHTRWASAWTTGVAGELPRRGRKPD